MKRSRFSRIRYRRGSRRRRYYNSRGGIRL